MVNRGIWHSQDGLKEVAIKMLPATSSTAAHVKLMQEAAMFAQFSSHPNVVQLYGVCTIGNPVSCASQWSPVCPLPMVPCVPPPNGPLCAPPNGSLCAPSQWSPVCPLVCMQDKQRSNFRWQYLSLQIRITAVCVQWRLCRRVGHVQIDTCSKPSSKVTGPQLITMSYSYHDIPPY